MESNRPAIFKHIVSRFGEDKTARVASFGTMQSKGVIDDVGRALAMQWEKEHPGDERNPWSLPNISRIKNEFDCDPDITKEKYPELFYYYDGLIDTKISQAVHPAGMVISPITLADNFGVFDKNNESCLMLDMENIHDFTGLAKYDFLILKTVQVIRDTCNYSNRQYPRTHEIDWNDEKVWDNIIKDPLGIFQFEGSFAFDSLKRFKPKSIFDMSLVTASIRPSGASYRDDLLAKKPHKNPSKLIDDILKDNYGYLIYQEDTIKFLQQVCGLSGSASDNIRRAIGRKQKDRLDAALPSILEGYCMKSSQPRDVAESEAKEFLQIIEDSASYQFGYNHSIAYCLLGYLCAYYRYYHPIEFITSFLNNAANEEDIRNGTTYASKIGIKITMPKWGISRSEYCFDKEKNIIAKGLASVKYMSSGISDELYKLAQSRTYTRFVDLLIDLDTKTSIDTRKLNILIKIDFFSDFGNQRELLRITELFYDMFNKGCAKKISKEKVDDTVFGSIISRYSTSVTKTGEPAKSYTIIDIKTIMQECEDVIKGMRLEDLDDFTKVRNFAEVMGYAGYVSGREEDRRKLYIMDIYPLKRKRDNKQFGYSIVTKSIGSGKESRFTVFNRDYDRCKIEKEDIIEVLNWDRDGKYFILYDYRKIL